MWRSSEHLVVPFLVSITASALWGPPHDGSVQARLLPAVRGPLQAGAGRANTRLPAAEHCNKKCFDVVSAAVVWRCTCPCRAVPPTVGGNAQTQ